MDNNKYPLAPMPDYALVQLPKKYESGLSAEKEKYATNTHGVLLNYCISFDEVSDSLREEMKKYYDKYVGHTVYFAQFEDGEAIKIDGVEYVFVPVKSVRGAKQNAEA